MKGICTKFETLGDGSCKIAISVPREFRVEAVAMAYGEVEISAPGSSKEDNLLAMLKILQDLSDLIRSNIQDAPAQETLPDIDISDRG